MPPLTLITHILLTISQYLFALAMAIESLHEPTVVHAVVPNPAAVARNLPFKKGALNNVGALYTGIDEPAKAMRYIA